MSVENLGLRKIMFDPILLSGPTPFFFIMYIALVVDNS